MLLLVIALFTVSDVAYEPYNLGNEVCGFDDFSTIVKVTSKPLENYNAQYGE